MAIIPTLIQKNINELLDEKESQIYSSAIDLSMEITAGMLQTRLDYFSAVAHIDGSTGKMCVELDEVNRVFNDFIKLMK